MTARSVDPSDPHPGEAAPQRAGATAALRAFVAVPFEDDTSAELQQLVGGLRESLASERIRWVPPDNLHLTLRFLGNIEADAVTPLLAALAERVSGVAPFRCTLSAVELFPSRTRPRVIAVGVEDPEPLVRLAERVDEAVAACGFPPEPRRFRAHVTLGRFRRRVPRGFDLDTAPVSIAFDADRVILFRSELTSGGARHTELGCAALLRPRITSP